jgi:hypothetical protein
MDEFNNPSPAGICPSAETCQVAGRMAPYITDEAGAGGAVRWSYCNASKSRFVYAPSSPRGLDSFTHSLQYTHLSSLIGLKVV